MKVENMTSSKGNNIANQFIITYIDVNEIDKITIFQSYKSTIVKITHHLSEGKRTIELDQHYWDYSVTTSKYRNLFLGETKKETQAKIDSGEYVLTNLN